MSKKKTLRRKMMAYACGGDPNAFARAKARAARERATSGLCQHADEERLYASDEEAHNDQNPPPLCATCNKPRLTVKIILVSGRDTMGRVAADVVSGFLR